MAADAEGEVPCRWPGGVEPHRSFEGAAIEIARRIVGRNAPILWADSPAMTACRRPRCSGPASANRPQRSKA